MGGAGASEMRSHVYKSLAGHVKEERKVRSRNIQFAALTVLSMSWRMLGQPSSQNLAKASLEDLLNTEVTSVSKKEQVLSKTGAAVFVISQEDIRRSGAANIPDLLRMVPGVEVAQIDSNQWAVSIRGFNALYANKVLVLVDGRTVYVTGFSGVYWDEVNVPLENIERIEVIRGPGGTVWGANAVNGVINIITKSSADTKGALVTVSGGSRGNVTTLAQYGSDAGASGAFRVFGRYRNVGHSVFAGGANAPDDWHVSQTGFRSDWQPSSADTVSLQGDFEASKGGEAGLFASSAPLAQFALNGTNANTSGDILGHWTHNLANGSQMSFQLYDTVIRHKEGGIKLANNTLDFEFEHHIALKSRHDVVWGIDYRFSDEDWTSSQTYGLSLSPSAREDNLFAVFLQDEVKLRKSLYLTVGSKFEHNAYTGFELEPSAQLVWTANDRHSLWISAAHAVRQPNQIDADAQFNEAVISVPSFGPALLRVVGNPHIQAEALDDYEAGYRGRLSSRFSLDVAAFFSFYNHLETDEPRSPYLIPGAAAPVLVVPLMFDNLGHARSHGVEVFANWNVTNRWKLSPGFSTFHLTTGIRADSQDASLAAVPGYSPRYQPQVRSEVNLRRNVDWDSSLKFVPQLTTPGIGAYTRLDSRLAWRVGESMEISAVGQNLLTRGHMEFVDNSGFFLNTEVKRGLFGKITWRF